MFTRRRESYLPVLPALPSVPSLTSELTIESPNVSPEHKLRSSAFHSHTTSISRSLAAYYPQTRAQYKSLEQFSPSSSAAGFQELVDQHDQSCIDAKYLNLELDSMKRENSALERQTIQLRKRVEELELQNLKIAERARQEAINSVINDFQMRGDAMPCSPSIISERITTSPIISVSPNPANRVSRQNIFPEHKSDRLSHHGHRPHVLKSPVQGNVPVSHVPAQIGNSIVLEPLPQGYSQVPRLKMNPQPLRRLPIPEFSETALETLGDSRDNSLQIETGAKPPLYRTRDPTSDDARAGVEKSASGGPRPAPAGVDNPRGTQKLDQSHSPKTSMSTQAANNSVTRMISNGRTSRRDNSLVVPSLHSILGFHVGTLNDEVGGRRSVQSPLPAPGLVSPVSRSSRTPPSIRLKSSGRHRPKWANGMHLNDPGEQAGLLHESLPGSHTASINTDEVPNADKGDQHRRSRSTSAPEQAQLRDDSVNRVLGESSRNTTSANGPGRAPHDVDEVLSHPGSSSQWHGRYPTHRAGTPFFEANASSTKGTWTGRRHSLVPGGTGVTSRHHMAAQREKNTSSRGSSEGLPPETARSRQRSNQNYVEGDGALPPLLGGDNSVYVDQSSPADGNEAANGFRRPLVDGPTRPAPDVRGTRSLRDMQASSISRTASSVATVSALLGSKSDKENIPPAFSSPPHPSMVRYRNPGIIASGRTESSARSSTLLQLLSSPMVSSQPFTESDRPPALASSYTHVRRHRGSGKGILSGESASFSAAGAGMRHVGASSADRFNRMTELVPSDSVSNLANDGNDGGEQERRRDIEPGPKSPLDSTCSFSIASEFSGTHLPDLPSLPETTPSPIMVPLDSFRHRDRIHGGTRGSNDGVESWKEERLHDVKSSGSRQSLTFLRERERQQKENRHTGSANQNAMGDGQLTKSANPTRQGPHVVAGGTGTRGLPIDGSFAAELRSLVTTEEYRKFVKDVMEYDSLIIDQQDFLANARGLLVTPNSGASHRHHHRHHILSNDAASNLHDRLRLYGMLAKAVGDFEEERDG